MTLVDDKETRDTTASRVASALVLALGMALGVALASTYFGHAPGPYGVCYGSSGRSVPCTVVAARRSAERPPNER
jgi:hypothetical protein